VQLADKLRVVHPTKADLRRVENREAFSTVDTGLLAIFRDGGIPQFFLVVSRLLAG
jgi:hypothetical protein